MWVVSLLKIAVIVFLAIFVFISLLPKLRELLLSSFKNQPFVNSLMFVILVYTGVFALQEIIKIVSEIKIELLINIFSVFSPGISFMVVLLGYLQWIIVGALLVVGFGKLVK